MDKTCFEDLSNEILYEIFEFLDYYSVCETFANLNIRFHYLLIHSSLPLKINLSNISKSMFEQRCKHILIPNIHRIVALSLSNFFTIDHFLKISPVGVSFNRLESLILNGIQGKTLVALLPDLASLPRLFFLSIMLFDHEINENILYKLVFRLPALRYATLLFHSDRSLTLPITVNEQEQCFTLRHLIINGTYRLDQLIAILSYTPLLNRISCQFLAGSTDLITQRLIVFSNITHMIIKRWTPSFDQFESFIANYFPKLELLHIAMTNDKNYLDAHRWEQLIIRYMPHLRRYDFRYHDQINDDEENDAFHALFDQFSSKFWYERKWFFGHEHRCLNDNIPQFILFSTLTFKKFSYFLYKDKSNNSCSYLKSHFNLIKHLFILDHPSNINYSFQFPSVVELTITNNFIRCADLNRMIIFSQLNTLALEFDGFSIDILLDFLYYAVNVRSLRLYSKPKKLPLSIEQMEKTCLISKNSKIVKLDIATICTSEYFRFFINLCPRLERLDTGVRTHDLEFIIRDLLSTNTMTTCSHLFSLRLWTSFNDETVKQLRTMIDTEKLLNDYSLECTYGALYLWW